jgi:WD40 repeat protein
MSSPLLATVIVSALVSAAAWGQILSTGDSSYDLYLTRIAAAEALLQLNKVSEARAHLAACNERERGFEWRFLNAALDQSSATTRMPAGVMYNAMCLSPNGQVLATAGSDKIIRLLSYPDLRLIRELKGHTGSVNTIDFSSDGTRLVSGGRDRSLILWDVATGGTLATNTSSFSQGIYQVRFGLVGA